MIKKLDIIFLQLLTTHLIGSKLRMNGAVLLLIIYSFVAYAGTTLLLLSIALRYQCNESTLLCTRRCSMNRKTDATE